MNEFEIIIRSIKDFFTKPILKIALLPLIFSMIIMYVLFFIAADFGFDSLQVVIEQSQNGEQVILDEQAPFYFVWMTYLIVFLFKYSITTWLVGFLFYTIGSIFIMMFSVFLTLIIIGFLTPMILRILHKRHYSHIEIHGHGTIIAPLWVLLKSGIVMILLFILLIPLYFIPLINIIAFNLPFYYLFHKLLNFDVASTLLDDSEYKEIYEKDSLGFRLRTVLLYMISMVPFITLFTAVFYIVYLGHAYYSKLEMLRKSVIDEMDNVNLKEEDKSYEAYKKNRAVQIEK